MALTRSLYHRYYIDEPDTRVEFFDTKFIASLLKQHSKFTSSTSVPYVFDPLEFQLLDQSGDHASNEGWLGAKHIYCPFSIGRTHWIALCISLEEAKITVLNCNTSFRRDDIIMKDLSPLAQMLPYLLHSPSPPDVTYPPFEFESVPGLKQGKHLLDSAIHCLLLIHIHATLGLDACLSFDPASLTTEAKKLAVMYYEEFVV